MSGLNTHEISMAMRNRWRLKEGYAMIEEVGNGTGARCTRHADAIVMNLWPSRGLEIMGFEYKASRSDWLNELKNPGKADPIFKFCDRWNLVVGDPSIVKDGELPTGWGLLVPLKMNEIEWTLKDKVGAAKLTPEPLDRPFVAAMLRRAAAECVSTGALDTAKQAEFNRGYQQGLVQGKRDSHNEADEFARLKETIKAFEAASGVSITAYHDGAALGQWVKIAKLLANEGGYYTIENMLRRCHDAAKDMTHRIKQVRKEIQDHLSGAGVVTEAPKEDPVQTAIDEEDAF